jgi:DNA primase
MPRPFSAELLFRLRNEIAIERLIAEHLAWPSKRREGRFYFLCPRCGEFRTGVNPRTNLGRCFRCAENFNPIDFVIVARDCDFVEAVQFLASHLPNRTAPLPSETRDP